MTLWTPEQAKAKAHRLVSEYPHHVFPIRIYQDAGKWNKVPLTRNGHKDATNQPDDLDWSKANGLGILTGSKTSLYVLDIDSNKPGCAAENWLKDYGLTYNTRTHSTISGGRHMIFTLRPNWRDLPTRANIVPGLDSRGNGGWIAFGAGYALEHDLGMGILPEQICQEIQAGWGGALEMYVNAVYIAPKDTDAICQRLQAQLATNASLRRRWDGNSRDMGKEGGGDTSASGMDFSVARMCAMGGFSYSEIIHILTLFKFGKWNASRTPLTPSA